jgi:hypothetical protein
LFLSITDALCSRCRVSTGCWVAVTEAAELERRLLGLDLGAILNPVLGLVGSLLNTVGHALKLVVNLVIQVVGVVVVLLEKVAGVALGLLKALLSTVVKVVDSLPFLLNEALGVIFGSVDQILRNVLKLLRDLCAGIAAEWYVQLVCLINITFVPSKCEYYHWLRGIQKYIQQHSNKLKQRLNYFKFVVYFCQFSNKTVSVIFFFDPVVKSLTNIRPPYFHKSKKLGQLLVGHNTIYSFFVA